LIKIVPAEFRIAESFEPISVASRRFSRKVALIDTRLWGGLGRKEG
jgi:hypothetical protein